MPVVKMVAATPMRYNHRSLRAGDEFYALNRRDAAVLLAVKRARKAPVEARTKNGSSVPENMDERTAARREYHAAFGKWPYHAWSPAMIWEKLTKR